MNENTELKRFTTINFLNLALGFLGLQFAWQMRIALAEPVTSSLGASPFLYSLIWLAGPFSGMVVQPIRIQNQNSADADHIYWEAQ